MVEELDVEAFRASLLQWWQMNRRAYPWRTTRDPYAILVAEALLHRTRADQVRGIYERFLQQYPGIRELARADPTELHELVYSAGLRWRIGLLLEAAREIARRFGGEIPRDRAVLESLPGVGPYISAAVRCFAFGEADAIVDSNVVRVYARVFNLHVTDQLRRAPGFHRLAAGIVDPEHPQEFNLAILDLAALICKPRNPRCRECPVSSHCFYGRTVLSG